MTVRKPLMKLYLCSSVNDILFYKLYVFVCCKIVQNGLNVFFSSAGVPYKTFGYINISISEANLKKCK